MIKDKSLIQSCIDHINTAIDVDPWAKEMVTEIGKEILEQLDNSNDCIDRQAAIETVRKCAVKEVTPAYMLIDRAEAMTELMMLPSAQPEIIRCRDCKHSEHWYSDKCRCFLWHETGIDVFEDGFCNYAERRADGRD